MTNTLYKQSANTLITCDPDNTIHAQGPMKLLISCTFRMNRMSSAHDALLCLEETGLGNDLTIPRCGTAFAFASLDIEATRSICSTCVCPSSEDMRSRRNRNIRLSHAFRKVTPQTNTKRKRRFARTSPVQCRLYRLVVSCNTKTTGPSRSNTTLNNPHWTTQRLIVKYETTFHHVDSFMYTAIA